MAVGQAAGALMGGTGASAGAGAAAGAFMLGGPVLIGYGVVRAVRNAKIDNRIEDRHTALPATVPANGELELDLFFPLSPSPRRLEIAFDGGDGPGSIALDTQVALAGLHLAPQDESRTDVPATAAIVTP